MKQKIITNVKLECDDLLFYHINIWCILIIKMIVFISRCSYIEEKSNITAYSFGQKRLLAIFVQLLPKEGIAFLP